MTEVFKDKMYKKGYLKFGRESKFLNNSGILKSQHYAQDDKNNIQKEIDDVI